jgi:hypothetical protein
VHKVERRREAVEPTLDETASWLHVTNMSIGD